MAEKVDVIGKDGKPVEDSSMFERLLFIERFFHRNRKKLITFGVAIVIAVAGYIGNGVYEDYRTEQVNIAYFNYKSGNDTENNLKFIEENSPKLYSLILFSEASFGRDTEKIKEFVNSKDPLLSDLATYQIASLNRDLKELNSYSYTEQAIYKDLATLSEAYLLILDGEVDKAKNRLSFIEEGSQLKEIANYLNHYGSVSK